jgi:hypothetical protein
VKGAVPAGVTERLKDWPSSTFVPGDWLIILGGTRTVIVKVQVAEFVP